MAKLSALNFSYIPNTVKLGYCLLRGVALSCALLIPGCTTLVSHQANDEDLLLAGAPYCLPLGKVEIEVVRNTAGMEAKAAAASAKDAAASAKDAAGSAKAAAESAKALAEAKKEDAGGEGSEGEKPKKTAAKKQDAKKKAEGMPQIQTEGQLQQQAETEPQTPTPAKDDTDGDTPVTVDQPKVSTSWDYKIRYKGTTYVPDPDMRFVVAYKGNAMADDDITVKVGKNSLLDAVNVTTEDKTVEVVKKIIEIGKNIVRIGAHGPAGDALPKEEVIFKASFDPSSSTEVARINAMLLQVPGGPYEVTYHGRYAPRRSPLPRDFPAKPQKPDKPIPYPGVLFRPAIACELELARKGVAQEVTTLLLPNQAETISMPVNRSAFIKKVQNLDFEDGMLVQATLKKPSEALGGVEIPLEITRAILALPGEIVGDNIAALKSQQDKETQALATLEAQRNVQRKAMEEETKDLKSELDYINAKKALDEAKK